MPILNLGPLPNCYDDDIAGLRILSVMFHPDDLEKREEIEGAIVHLATLDSPLPIFARRLFPNSDVSGAVGWGPLLAGNILLFNRLLSELEQPISLNKTACMVEAVISKGGVKQKKGLQRNERAIKDAWRKYKCVSPFWSAWLIWGAFHPGPPEQLRSDIFDNLPIFLAVAEDMRRFGEQAIEPKSKTPLLSDNVAWRVADEVRLPSVSVRLPPLPEAAQRALATYKAP